MASGADQTQPVPYDANADAICGGHTSTVTNTEGGKDL
jgi:hypothetical protein